MLYSHTFNERLLMPYWIQHHANMFDKAYIFDYGSTDSTIETIKRLAPSSWTVIKSANVDFDARAVDQEIMQMEAWCDNCWKLVLTTTEFLVHEDLRKELAERDAHLGDVRCLQIPMVMMVDDTKEPLLQHKSLPSQRSQFIRTGGQSYVRYMHNFFAGEYTYGVGRHVLNTKKTTKCELTQNSIIFKYKFSPWPEVRPRLSQVGTRIPKKDEEQRLGIQHTKLKNNLTAVDAQYAAYCAGGSWNAFNFDESCVDNANLCLPHGYCMTCAVHQIIKELFYT